MVKVKPFAAVRPAKSLATEIAAPPYDVLNSEEAKKMAGEKSLLHITKPEIDFDPILPDHDQNPANRARRRGILVRIRFKLRESDILKNNHYLWCLRKTAKNQDNDS